MIHLLVQAIIQLLFRPFTGFWHACQDRLRGAGTADWQKVKGCIHSCQIGSGNHLWRATVIYSYCCEGEYWSGETSRPFAREEDADAYVHLHPSGSSLMVRVDPGGPAKSVVLTEDQMLVGPTGSI
jgi:hypothetical protein